MYSNQNLWSQKHWNTTQLPNIHKSKVSLYGTVALRKFPHRSLNGIYFFNQCWIFTKRGLIITFKCTYFVCMWFSKTLFWAVLTLAPSLCASLLLIYKKEKMGEKSNVLQNIFNHRHVNLLSKRDATYKMVNQLRSSGLIILKGWKAYVITS